MDHWKEVGTDVHRRFAKKSAVWASRDEGVVLNLCIYWKFGAIYLSGHTIKGV